MLSSGPTIIVTHIPFNLFKQIVRPFRFTHNEVALIGYAIDGFHQAKCMRLWFCVGHNTFHRCSARRQQVTTSPVEFCVVSTLKMSISCLFHDVL